MAKFNQFPLQALTEFGVSDTGAAASVEMSHSWNYQVQ